MKRIRHIDRAVAILGGQAQLARAIGVSQPHVWYWVKKANKLPAEQAGPIEKATSGLVTKHDLRPDLFPDEPTLAE